MGVQTSALVQACGGCHGLFFEVRRVEEKLYAGVIVDVRAEAVNRIFQYAVPERYRSVLQIGHRVLVPFGRRKLEGYVVEFSSELEVEEHKLRSILKPLDPEPVILPSLVELARWMAETYAGLFSEALQFMLPPASRYGRERVGVKTAQVVALREAHPELRPNAWAQRRVVEILRARGQMLASELLALADASSSTLHSLEKNGVISLDTVRVERAVEVDAVPDPPIVLTEKQQEAVEAILEEMDGARRPVLLHGVTGSGKTEVYLQVIAEVLRRGQQAIVLVPEIALTPQILNRFAARFKDRVTVLHSALSLGERFDQWCKIHAGLVDVVVGARSAVFAPLPRLGLIVLDEEHERTYKQEDGSIRYQTREVAIKRCALVGGQVVLGSATPAVESYHRALKGDYVLTELPERVEKRPLPAIEIVDMREEFAQGNRSMFSRRLREELTCLAGTRRQAIILLNRRGFASFVLCRECGEVLGCPNCQVSLTYHKGVNRLKCHYCLHQEALPRQCPKCASRYLRQFGVGSEQLEETLSKEVPELKTLRLDADTTRRKGAHASILRQFAQGQAQVLIGTQMVAKGLDFPQVTLVGVLAADLSLRFPDIRSSERTFQLLTQVAGRSGRGELPGTVIVQAYEPNHFALETARQHDYLSFYRKEIGFRRALGYPPFRHLTRILCSGPKRETEDACRLIANHLLDQGVAQRDLIGPFPAPVNRIQGRYRWQVLVKSDEALQGLGALPAVHPDVQVTIDLDPLHML